MPDEILPSRYFANVAHARCCHDRSDEPLPRAYAIELRCADTQGHEVREVNRVIPKCNNKHEGAIRRDLVISHTLTTALALAVMVRHLAISVKGSSQMSQQQPSW